MTAQSTYERWSRKIAAAHRDIERAEIALVLCLDERRASTDEATYWRLARREHKLRRAIDRAHRAYRETRAAAGR